MRQANPTIKLSAVLLACSALLSACGGGGGGDATGGNVQDITLDFPGSTTLASSSPLVATTSSGLPVTFVSNTPTICKVEGAIFTPLSEGECKITATQPGGTSKNGTTYASISQSELIVISKHEQKLTSFVVPDVIPLGGAPVELTATSSSGLPVSFTSTSTSVCTLSGSTVTPVSTGQCAVTATQEGDATYLATTSVTKLISVGVPTLTFASGYAPDVDATTGWSNVSAAYTTVEHGAIMQSANGYWLGWGGGWNGPCGNGGCSKTYSIQNGSFISSVLISQADIDSAVNSWEHSGSMNVGVLAPGLAALSTTANTVGLKIGGQQSLLVNLAENAEWFSTPVKNVNVDLYLGRFALKPDNDPNKPANACNVKVRATVTPTAAASTNYTLNLADFKIQESCGLTLNDADVLTQILTYSVVEVEFSTADNINGTKPDASGTNFPTVLTLGAITFK